MEPTTTEITAVDICYDISMNTHLQALIISDLHIGQKLSAEMSTKKVFIKIKSIVKKEKANYLFILGDIVDHQKDNKIWKYFFQNLETLAIPVHVIPGNHDRYLSKFVNIWYKGKNVFFHDADIIRFFLNDSSPPIIMGHDLKNDKKVHNTLSIRRWVAMLRKTFNGYIPDESLLILGHVHQFENLKEENSYIIAPFSSCLNTFQYGKLCLLKDNIFSIKFVTL